MAQRARARARRDHLSSKWRTIVTKAEKSAK
jgi:hypothetical protein